MTPEQIEQDQLERLGRGENICSSDRPTDRARTRLKKRGLIEFDRPTWRWKLTDAGRSQLMGRKP